MNGGARPGAGRPKGTPNRATAAKIADIAASGLTPLEYMLDILRNPDCESAERFEAAKQAAPYCHARLAATTHDMGRETIVLLADIIDQRRHRVAEIADGD